MPPRAAPKPPKAGKSATTLPAAPIALTDHANHVPLDPPITPPPWPQVWICQLQFETPGEHFSSVSPGSSDSDAEILVTEDVFAPLVLISPIKRCQRQAAPTINRLTDLEVRKMTDEEIVGTYLINFKIQHECHEVYDHYDIGLRPDFTPTHEPLSLTLVFTCKTHWKTAP